MRFDRALNEKIIIDKGVDLSKGEDFAFAFFYDITDSNKYETRKEIKDCIIGGPEYGNAIRFIADGKNKKFIVFRPDCLHYRVASQLGYEYPKNTDVLFGTGRVDLSVSTRITDIDFSTLDEMPRNKEYNKFFEKIVKNKWGWATHLKRSIGMIK